MKNYLILPLWIGCICCFLTSCSNEDPLPPIDLKTICKDFSHEKVFLVLNGDTLTPSVNMTLAFSEQELTEEEIHEAKMLMETTNLWPGDKKLIYDMPNIQYDIDVIFSPNEITFTGKTDDSKNYYSLSVVGTIRNDSAWLDMTYKTIHNELLDRTFELEMSSDSYLLEKLSSGIAQYQDTVIWNGVTYTTIDFVRESLQNIYTDFVARSGIDAYRMTFREDGRLDLQARNAADGTYTPIDGYYAYRFHLGYQGWGGGVFEVGQNEADAFYRAFIEDKMHIFYPNHLFHTFIRGKVYTPVTLRNIFYREEDDDEVEERLYIEMTGFKEQTWWNFTYFLNEWTKNVSDYSDKMMRLRKISRLLNQEKIADEFLLYLKEVK